MIHTVLSSFVPLTDGGNEKNFPVPPDMLERMLQSNSSSGGSGRRSGGEASSEPDTGVEPPAGIAFRNVTPVLDLPGGGAG